MVNSCTDETALLVMEYFSEDIVHRKAMYVMQSLN